MYVWLHPVREMRHFCLSAAFLARKVLYRWHGEEFRILLRVSARVASALQR